MLIQWGPSLELGVAEIDAQHSKLVDYVNEFHDAFLNKAGEEAQRELFAKLANYTVEHFATEEKYFAQFGYPETEEHKKEHAALIATVTELSEKLNSGEQILSMKIMTFLKDWLSKHIQGSDKKYAPFFKENGL